MGNTLYSTYLNETINGIKINTSIKCNSTNYQTSSSRNVQYIVIHYTGNQKDLAVNNAKYFQGTNRKASAHFFVDNTSIYQSVDLKNVAWHCGGSSYKHKNCRNINSIGIEMCCTDGNYMVSTKTQENTAYLCARLCKILGISDNEVDTYVLTHNLITGKICPRQYVTNPQQFVAFKNMVKDILNKGVVVNNVSNSTSTTPSTSNKTSKEVPVKITQSKTNVQKYLNEYYGTQIKYVLGKLLVVDGILGTNSKRGIAIAMQVELNKLGANLTVDGKFGGKSSTAFTKYVGTLKKGSKGIFVTLWQCLLLANNLDPRGIDGIMGDGCVKATNDLFAKINLSKDSIVSGADINTLL